MEITCQRDAKIPLRQHLSVATQGSCVDLRLFISNQRALLIVDGERLP